MQQRSLRRFLWIIAALIVLLVVGTSGYQVLEDMNTVDALYMAVITLSTVGFGEVKELSPEGRLFTIILIIGGGGLVTYGLGVAGEFFFSGAWRIHLEERRKQQMLQQLSEHTIVCGYGRIGRYVIAELKARELSFVVIDLDMEKIEAIQQEGYLALRGDGADEMVLRSAGIERAYSLVATAGTDAENVFIVLTARSLNNNLLIIARANSDTSEPKLLRAGANRVILPYNISGRRIVTLLYHPAVADFLDDVMHAGNLELVMDQVRIGSTSSLVGKTLREAHLRGRLGVTVLAYRMPDAHINVSPSAETVLEAGAQLIVLGTPEHLQALIKIAGS